MSPHPKHHLFFQNGASDEENSRILNADPKSLEFEIHYFKYSCIAATSRYILAFGNANWVDKYSELKSWRENPEESLETPFGVLPILQVKSGSHQVTLSESVVVDNYLAKKFNLLGSTEYEEQTIKAFYISIHYLRERSLQTMSWTFPEKRKERFGVWLNERLPSWIKIQEEHLERNGSNGHFYGDKLSLADIHLVSILDHFAIIPRGDEFVALFQASPLLWKVHETVVKNPIIAEYRESDAFKALVQGGKQIYAQTAF